MYATSNWEPRGLVINRNFTSLSVHFQKAQGLSVMSKSTGGARKGLCILAGRKKKATLHSSDLAEGKQIRQWVSVRRVRPTTTAGGLLGMRDQGGLICTVTIVGSRSIGRTTVLTLVKFNTANKLLLRCAYDLQCTPVST